MVAGSFGFPTKCGYQAGTLPKLDAVVGDQPLGGSDGSNIVGTDYRFETFDMAVAVEDVCSVFGHVMHSRSRAGALSSQSPIDAEDRAAMS